MPKMPATLVNRGPAGLLKKVDKKDQAEVSAPLDPIEDLLKHGKCPECVGKPVLRTCWCAKHAIAKPLRSAAVDIDQLTLDPRNARLHPERNMESIKLSLLMYGQTTPIAVRKKGMVVMAGNGRVEAAKALGWTKIACTVLDFSEAQAVGFGLADNRSAELAKWDFEVVAQLDKLLQESKQYPVGWSLDELEVLRAAEWTPPPIDEDALNGREGMTLKVSAEQYEVIEKAIEAARSRNEQPKMDVGECLKTICHDWLGE